MPVADVLDFEGHKVGEIVLSDRVFAVEPNEGLLYTVVRMQLAAKRQGTASTKTRSEVRSSGRKPWRQKGTGRARAGTRSSPLWRGGGTIFGPKPRSYAFSVPRKVKKAAMRSALSSKLRDRKLLVVEGEDLPTIKTKRFVSIMNKLNLQSSLIVIDGKFDNLRKSARNVPRIKVIRSAGLNVYDVLKYDDVVLTRDAVDYIERVYGT